MNRPPMNQEDFDKRFQYELPKHKASAWRKMMAITTKYWRPFTSPRNLGCTIVSFMPILHWLPKYEIKSNLVYDIIGGLTVGIMHVPQGIAYALLAAVDPVNGLYTSFFPVLIYMCFGTSRHCSIGTFAVVALMTGKVVHKMTAVDSISSDHLTNLTASVIEHTPIQIASTLTVLIGLIQVLIAFLGLDFVTTYFSDELVGGFTTGASTHVFVTQLSDVLGISGLPRRHGLANLILKIYDFCGAIKRTNLITLCLSTVTMFVLILGKDYVNPWMKKKFHCSVPIPFELIVVILGTIISYLAHLNVNFNVAVVGRLPAGLPEPALPHFELFPSLLVDALSISVVTLAIHVSLAKIFANKYQYEVDTNQECYAVGFTSVLSGFFPIFPPSCSLSRSMVSAGAGSKSQLSSIPSSLFIFVVVQFSGSWLQSLPMCVLSSIIVVALLGMFRKYEQLKKLWSLSKIDFSIWVTAFVATLVTDVMQGLAIAILFALFTTVIRVQWPRWHILGNISGTSEFRDMERYRHTYFFENVCVLRFDSPLLFTNVQRFRTVVEKLAGDWNGTKFCGNIEKKQLIIEDQNYKAEPTTVLPQDQKRFLIIDCSGFAYVDIMGVNTLKEVHEDLQSRNITVSFAAAKAPVRELFEASGFYKAVAKTNFYPTIYDAILSAQMEQSALSMEAALEENCSAQVATNAAVESKTCKERSHSVQDGEMMRL